MPLTKQITTPQGFAADHWVLHGYYINHRSGTVEVEFGLYKDSTAYGAGASAVHIESFSFPLSDANQQVVNTVKSNLELKAKLMVAALSDAVQS